MSFLPQNAIKYDHSKCALTWQKKMPQFSCDACMSHWKN